MSETKFTPGPWVVDPKYPRDIQAPDGLDVGRAPRGRVD